MFKFFHSPARLLKPKKTVQLPTETMQKTLEDHNTYKPYNKDPISSKQVHQPDNANPTPSSTGQDWKSEGLKSTNDTDSERGHETMVMRKCVSLGTGLAAYQGMPSGEESSCNSYGNRSGQEYHNGRASVSPQKSSNVVNHSIDSSPDRLHEEVGGSSIVPHGVVKSNSLPYMHLVHTDVVDKSVDNNTTENDSVDYSGKSDGEEAYDYAGSAKDWIVPTVDEPRKCKSVQDGNNSGSQWEGLPNEDFKIRRIEKWVIDLQHSSSLEDNDTLTDHENHWQNGESTILDPVPAAKNDAKSVTGIDAAKRYISSLNAAATTAQLANHGLVVIPFLTSFSSLRALNLSGNSIVRITVGALPRSLHVLNLSKNSISTIEGLRELTRLRVLDLSYNRILRIGHGLAACSSLKEVYLAGNKISEVDGLHRLLKLSVLDLRFNKLSTTKSLGQLAANNNSLQAISLEGNPAQKNIGDEQLKKFLTALLPNIAYFNRQSIKSSALKDSSDRSARLGTSAHQTDRGLRSKSNKATRGRSGRNVRLPPSGVKSIGDRHQVRDVSGQRVSFRPDHAMRRAHSEGLLRAV